MDKTCGLRCVDARSTQEAKGWAERGSESGEQKDILQRIRSGVRVMDSGDCGAADDSIYLSQISCRFTRDQSFCHRHFIGVTGSPKAVFFFPRFKLFTAL